MLFCNRFLFHIFERGRLNISNGVFTLLKSMNTMPSHSLLQGESYAQRSPFFCSFFEVAD